MTISAHLPQLPLMLAGIARPAVELIRRAGIPTATLPHVALSAGGAGRFVLYDSRSSTSSTQARRAKNQGLELIDLAAISDCLGPQGDPRSPSDRATQFMAAATAGQFLDKLKQEIEGRGGLWLRLADYPFPYQSAICVLVEHLSQELTDLPEIVAGFPGKVTHFVSSRLRADQLALVAAARLGEVGWVADIDSLESSARKTQSHWATRLDRFRAAGLNVNGLISAEAHPAIPSPRSLMQLGLRYMCHPQSTASCHAERPFRCPPESAWIHFGIARPNTMATEAGPADCEMPKAVVMDECVRTFLLRREQELGHRLDAAHVLGPENDHPHFATNIEPQEWMVEWVRGHYQAGNPLFIHETTSQIELVHELLCLTTNAARCSLMWQTTFSEFARWWTARRQLNLQVWKRDEGYEIHASGNFDAFPWSVEIWRGQHVATLPIKQPTLNIRDDGIVFLKALNKGSAGFSAHQVSIQKDTLLAAAAR